MSTMGKRQVHIRDSEGKLIYTRLHDDGRGPLTFDDGFGFIDRLDVQRYQWQVCDGWPQLSRLFNRAERFPDWPAACDAACERQRPIIARVGDEIAKVFPSRQCHTLFAGAR